MTMMIPKECLDSNPIAQDFYQNLYKQLGPEYKVIQRVKIPEQKIQEEKSEGKPIAALEGSLVWVQFKQQSLFIYLSDTPADFFDASELADANSQTSIKDRLLNSPELLALMRLQNSLLPPLLRRYKAELTPFLMIFTNIENGKLNIGIKSLGISLLGKDQISVNSERQNNLRKLIQNFIGEPVSQATCQHIRYQFNPEISLRENQHNHFTLDNEQETFIKSGLLKPEDETRFAHLNLRSIHGDTSSGKTEAILHRAKIINQSISYHNDKVLILAPTDLAAETLRLRYANINEADNSTEILSINRWYIQQLKLSKAAINNIIDSDSIENTTQFKALIPDLTKHNISQHTFIEEMAFIQARAFTRCTQYLHAARNKGVTTDTNNKHINNKQYKAIWKFAEQFKKSLAQKKKILASDLPQQLFSAVTKNKTLNEQYNHVLIDDAHMLPPIVLLIMKKMLKAKTGQLFISQNPNHILINENDLWRDAALELRNNCIVLMHNYRINPYILNAANAFHLKRLPERSERALHRNLPNMSINPMPQLLHFHAERDEKSRLLDKIKRLIHSGTPLTDILLVVPDHKSALHFKKLLKATLEVPVSITGDNANNIDSDGHTNKKPSYLKICQLKNIAGHSAPYSFITGMQKVFDAEDALKKYKDEHQALTINNTHNISLAMSSAKKELTLLITTDTIPKELVNLHIDIPSLHAKHYAEVRPLHGSR